MMAPRNPSELARQEEMVNELNELLSELRSKLKTYLTKSEKEKIHQSIVDIERMLDLEHIPYNKSP